METKTINYAVPELTFDEFLGATGSITLKQIEIQKGQCIEEDGYIFDWTGEELVRKNK